MEPRQITEERFIELMAFAFPTFKIAKSNLTYPTSQFVSSFYSLILGNVIELQDYEEIWNITKDQLAYINSYHPESTTFIQHVWSHNLHSAVKYVFSHLRQSGTEFYYSDMLFPENTPRRTFVFMTLMLHFYWFINDFEGVLSNELSSCMEEVRVKENLKAEREKLLLQVQQHKEQKTHYAESCKDTKTSITKNADLIEEEENIIKELLAKEELILKELEKVEEEEQNLQDTLNKLRDEKKYLESLVVSNGNQVVDVFRKSSTKKDELVKKIKTFEEQVKTASSKLIQSNKALELQQKLNLYFKDEIQGTVKGFKSLFDSISFLEDKKIKLAEEETTVKFEALEAEKALPKLKKQFSQLEAQQHAILSKGKEQSQCYADLIDNQKKNYSQLVLKVKKDGQDIENFESVSEDISAKCSEIENVLKGIELDNKEKYMEYTKEISLALSSMQEVIGEDLVSNPVQVVNTN